MTYNQDMSSSAHARNIKALSNMGAPTKTAKESKAAAAKKMHKRSRSGCYTCRLRRKKCDEGQPFCRACKHLGLKCEYKKPMWWGNSDSRRKNKENIKEIIKTTQLAKKQAQTPPSSCQSLTTSDNYSESKSQTRDPSVATPPSDSGTTHVSPEECFILPPLDASFTPHQHPMHAPFEIDIKVERQLFVNDVPTRRDSTISTFSTFQPPPLLDSTPGHGPDSWVQEEYFKSQHESFVEEAIDLDFLQLPHNHMTSDQETIIEVEECDRPLLNHFIDKVAKLIFPILDANQHGSAKTDIILPALGVNKCYLHCCLSIAAVHMKAIDSRGGQQFDDDITKHRCATITELCEALGRDTNHSQILEATLGMIIFNCSVGRPDDSLPDIPWHQHFQAATSLVHRLELPTEVVTSAKSAVQYQPPVNMSLTAWIDILGATMLGRSPVFADTYRKLNIANLGLGLAELMGCEDHLMFLISEIACLEARKLEGLEEAVLYQFITILGNEIGRSEAPHGSIQDAIAAGVIQSAISATGAVRPKQLRINMSYAFRIAARIYLCTLLPGFQIGHDCNVNLVNTFVEVMNYIPAGVEGFDRSLIWPILVAGSSSLPGSTFRTMFEERCRRLGEASNFGSFGRMREIFADVWQINDPCVNAGDYQSVHWRDVMQQKGWDSLLI